MTGRVRLAPVNEQNLEPLLSVAVAEAEPDDVMPPVDAPAGWSQARREAFRAFHRAHFGGLDGPGRSVMFAIQAGDDVVGMIRLSRRDEPGELETGMWLGRSARGQGIAVAALRELLLEAASAGGRTVVAETTADNAAALGVLRRCGATLASTGSKVRAEISID